MDKVQKRFGEVERRQATAANKLAVTTDDKSKDCAQGSDNGAPTTEHMMTNHRKFSSRP